MTTNLFVIANVKQLRTGGSFSILLPFFRTSWGIGVLNSSTFNSFLQSGWVWHDFGGSSEFRGVQPPLLGTPLMMLNLHQWNIYLLETLLIPCIVNVLWNPEVNYCVQNSLTTVPRLSHIDKVYSFPSFSFHFNFNVNLHPKPRVPKRNCPLSFPNRIAHIFPFIPVKRHSINY